MCRYKGFTFSGMWLSVMRWVVPDLSKDCGAILLRDCMTMKMKAIRPFETVEATCQHKSVTSYKNRILRNSTEGTWNPLRIDIFLIGVVIKFIQNNLRLYSISNWNCHWITVKQQNNKNTNSVFIIVFAYSCNLYQAKI